MALIIIALNRIWGVYEKFGLIFTTKKFVTTQHRSVRIIIAWGNAPGAFGANYYSLGLCGRCL